MALVVTARSQIQAPRAGLAESTHFSTARGLAISSAVAYVLAVVCESASRAAPAQRCLDLTTLVVTGLAFGLTLLACAASWVTRRDATGPLLAATLAPVLLAVRSLFTAVLVSFDMATVADVSSVGFTYLALASLVWAAAVPGASTTAKRLDVSVELFRRVAEVTTFVIFAVALSGATVRAVGASWACRGAFPDCNGLPFGSDPLADIQLYHRLLSYVSVALVLWLTIEALRTQRHVFGTSLTVLGLMLVDAIVGGVSVSTGVQPVAEVAHTAASLATWSAAVGLIVVAHRAPPAQASAIALPAKLIAYVQLTKPRVMSLLLATTAAAMVIAAHGMPNLKTFFATLIGGALMSGGAGAINHYVDRDIDPLMGRTAWRPIPSGVIAPAQALWFGIALAVVASAIFVTFVNPLACVLALLGLLGYVFIYTLWLKRSTPSNIVIGGAAGAIPPLVGWAAVTNEIGSLTAWYLFAIIFFWTPPHFWALSLLIRKHYERAGVPMLPVVRGEEETRRQILLYSVLMVVLTLVLSPLGMMGWIYFAAASLLGGLFIFDAVRLWREATPQAARRLYLYSILYLFVLFTAMAVDRAV